MDGENFVSSNKNPGEFLKQALGKAVVVKLNSGVDYRGVLACLDGFMNIAMVLIGMPCSRKISLYNVLFEGRRRLLWGQRRMWEDYNTKRCARTSAFQYSKDPG